MRDDELLQLAAGEIRQTIPNITAEAIVIFLLLAGEEVMRLGELAASIGISEPEAHKFLHELTGGTGLVKIVNIGGGGNEVLLTEKGHQLKQVIDARISAV